AYTLYTRLLLTHIPPPYPYTTLFRSDVGGAAQDAGADDRQGDADRADQDRDRQELALRADLADQPLGRGPEVLGALTGAQAALGVLLTGDVGGGVRLVTGQGGLVLLLLQLLLSFLVGGRHQATSSSTPWERTISR